MSETLNDKEWQEKLLPVLKIKAEEFELLDYGQVDPEEIWKCVEENIERGKIEKPLRLHQLVNEVLSLSLNDYMNRLRMDSLRGPNWFENDQPLHLNEFDEK